MEVRVSIGIGLRIGFGLVVLAAAPIWAQTPAGAEFFEKEIRPVLAEKCYGCHSSKLDSPMGGLVLDTKEGIRRGGADGPVIVPGNPASSLIVKALSYTDNALQMPPTGKLPDATLAAFSQWIAAGAPDPREDTPATASAAPPAKSGMDIETGRKWWAFQPVAVVAQPKVKDAAYAKKWAKGKLDWFVLEMLERNKLKPSPEADRATLIERAYARFDGTAA